MLSCNYKSVHTLLGVGSQFRVQSSKNRKTTKKKKEERPTEKIYPLVKKSLKPHRCHYDVILRTLTRFEISHYRLPITDAFLHFLCVHTCIAIRLSSVYESRDLLVTRMNACNRKLKSKSMQPFTYDV